VFLLGFATALLLVYAYGYLGGGNRPTEPTSATVRSLRDDRAGDRVVPASFTAEELRSAARPLSGPKKASQLSEVIDVNRASVAELQRLPGIGPVLSQRIADERDRRRFASVDDLDRVPGIGPKIIERLRPYIIVDSDSVRVAADR
jgi:competence protein ComEA